MEPLEEARDQHWRKMLDGGYMSGYMSLEQMHDVSFAAGWEAALSSSGDDAKKFTGICTCRHSFSSHEPNGGPCLLCHSCEFYCAELDSRSAPERQPFQQLIAQWEKYYEAFTSPFYRVSEPPDAIKGLRQCIDELKEVIAEAESSSAAPERQPHPCRSCGMDTYWNLCGACLESGAKAESSPAPERQPDGAMPSCQVCGMIMDRNMGTYQQVPRKCYMFDSSAPKGTRS